MNAENYPESPLTVGRWVRIAQMGHTTVYGQVLSLENVITVGIPAVPETEQRRATPARTICVGYGAVFELSATTEDATRAEWAERAPWKPYEELPDHYHERPEVWDPDKLISFRDLTPEQRALAMEFHARNPEWTQASCARAARRVSHAETPEDAEDLPF